MKESNSYSALKNLALSAMFLSLGLLLPFLTGQIPKFGSMLLPMHIPVFLCALICPLPYGVVVGFVLPLLRFALFGSPILYPMGISMAFELSAYAFFSGFIYKRSKWKCTKSLYKALLSSMVIGRCVWGLVQWLLLSLKGTPFTFSAFFTSAVLTSIPGITIQLILIPVIMIALKRAKLVPKNVILKKPKIKKEEKEIERKG